MLRDQEIKRINFANDSLKGEYDGCTFANCQFAAADLSSVVFSDCTFIACDLSNAKLINTSFRDIRFENCKLVGMRFEDCKTFLLAFHFNECILNFASFYSLNLPKIQFKNCQLQDVDFTESNLLSASFQNCELINAIFDRTNLEKADFRTARNFDISPQSNKVKGAKFSKDGLAGLVRNLGIIID